MLWFIIPKLQIKEEHIMRLLYFQHTEYIDGEIIDDTKLIDN